MTPLPPLTKADLRKALDAIWHKAPVELKDDIDVLCDEIKERGLAGDMAEGVPSPAGSMMPPEAEPEPEAEAEPEAEPESESESSLSPSASPPPSAHAATDWGTGSVSVWPARGSPARSVGTGFGRGDAMTTEQIKQRVTRVAAIVNGEIDCPSREAQAHAEEDELYRDVLRAIAEGQSVDAPALARAALKAASIRFSRWYE